MKNTKIFALMLAVVAMFVACESSNTPQQNEPKKDVITKEWHIESWNEQTPEFDVYIEFLEQGTFNIYQQVYTLNYVRYSGTYTAVDGQLSGVYDNGVEWDSSYTYTISADGSQLTLVSKEFTPITSVYVNETIPEAVKAEAENTRSVEVVPFL